MFQVASTLFAENFAACSRASSSTTSSRCATKQRRENFGQGRSSITCWRVCSPALSAALHYGHLHAHPLRRSRPPRAPPGLYRVRQPYLDLDDFNRHIVDPAVSFRGSLSARLDFQIDFDYVGGTSGCGFSISYAITKCVVVRRTILADQFFWIISMLQRKLESLSDGRQGN
jgi:hypothetical protein